MLRSPLSNALSNSAMQPQPTRQAATVRTAYPASSSDQASTEKEEGELSEDGSSTLSSAALRSSPTKTPAVPHQTKAAALRSDLSTSKEGNRTSHALFSQRERAKIFIKSWNRSGFTFHQLTQEGFNPQILATLYEELGLQIDTTAQSSSSRTQHPAATELESSTQQPILAAAVSQADLLKSQPSEEPPQSASAAPQSDQSNRESYIARLMAVKGKKTTSDKPDAASEAASTLSRPKSSNHVDPNLPTPPIYSAALFSLNTLLRKLGLATSFLFEQTREQSFAVDLRIQNFPEHLQPHLRSALAMGMDQPAKCLGADVSLEPESVSDSQSTLRICLQDFQSKKLAKQGAARVAFTVITAAVDGHEEQVTSTAHHTLESDDPKSATAAPAKDLGSKQNDQGQDINEIRADEAIDETSQAATGWSGDGELLRQKPKAAASPADNSFDARKKAQTELLRQKMQALKLAKLQAAQATGAPAPDNVAPNEPGSSSSAESVHSNAFEQPLDQENIISLTSRASKIPGLFMAPPANNKLASTVVEPSNSQSDHQNNSSIPSLLEVPSATTRVMRKRPVAADFNDDVESPITKRPFGQIRGGEEDEAIIIEASDDEYDFDNDFNSKTSGLKSTASPAKATDNLMSRKLANSGPLRSFGAENSYQVTGRAQTPVGGSNGFDKRQKEIVEMKKKIAEMEAKRKAKLYSSRPATPSSAPGSYIQAEPTEQNLTSGDQLDSAPAESQLSKGSSPYPSADPGQSTPVQQSEWKLRRKTEIESNLPAIEASFEDDSRELERLRLQMEQLQDDMKKKQENKKRLIEELEGLGVDTDGMAHSELQATKDFLDRREPSEDGNNTMEAPQTLKSPVPDAVENSSRSSMSISSPEETNATPVILNNSSNTGSFKESSVLQHMPLDGNAHAARKSSYSDESNLYAGEGINEVIQASAAAPPSQPSLEHEKQVHTPLGNSTGSSAHFADNESMGSSGSSVEKVGSRSLMLPENEDIRVSLNVNPNTRHLEAQIAEEDSDDYEPSDPWEADRTSNAMNTASPANAGKDTESSQMDESEDEYEPTDFYEHSEKQTPEETSFGLHRTKHGAEMSGLQQSVEPNDIASEKWGSLGHVQKFSELDSARELPPAERFTHYRSALKYFKSHTGPTPTDGEAQSPATFHTIDHQREICPFELAGGVCNDEKCGHQHFRSMNIEGSDFHYNGDRH